MPQQIDFRSPLPFPAAEVYATMIDPEYLRARLQQIGGPGAALLEHSVDAGGARYRLRHGLDSTMLPALVRSLVPGDLVIERTETIRLRGPGDYTGQVEVQVPGTPVSARGHSELRERAPGSEFAVQAEVTVNVPFIGGRIEETVAGQVHELLVAETAFTEQWMRARKG
jgi:Protein of unknown function (DUF2505)